MLRKPDLFLSALAITLMLAPAALAETTVDITGEVRVRNETSDRSFKTDVAFENFTIQRTRLKMTAVTEKGASVVVELQDSRTWGDEGARLGLDDSEGVDMYQGYLAVDCTLVPGSMLILGRQAAAYGQQRVVGTVGWDNVGRSLDVARLHVPSGNHWVDITYGKLAENLSSRRDDDGTLMSLPDVKLLYIYGHLDLPNKNLVIEPFLVHVEVDPSRHARTSVGDYAKLTSGRFVVQQDFVYQTGTAGGADQSAYLIDGELAIDASADADGSFGVIGGYSLYTGDDGEGGYFQLLPTAHKFHGLMDVAMKIAGSAGLQDVYGKAWVKLPHGLVGKVAYHLFTTEQELALTDGGDNDLGTELDIVLSRKIPTGMDVMVGGGLFFPGNIPSDMPAWGDETASWFFLQGTVPF